VWPLNVRPDHKFLEAFIDDDAHRILGRRLRPFCLWHLLLLQTLDSPFLRKGRVELFDLQTAAAVCSTRFRDCKLRRPRIGPINLWRIVYRDGFNKGCAAFLAYVGDYLQRPEFSIIPPKEGGGSRGQRGRPPEVLRVVADIIAWAHWPEAFVWEMPIGAAYWYQAMSYQDKGADVDFMTESEREYQRQLKERLERDGNGSR